MTMPEIAGRLVDNWTHNLLIMPQLNPAPERMI
jgi:hypothetical protein